MLEEDRRAAACCVVMQSDAVLKSVTAVCYDGSVVVEDLETHCEDVFRALKSIEVWRYGRDGHEQ
jgi:hypothetical protein